MSYATGKCDHCDKRLSPIMYFFNLDEPGAYCTKSCQQSARIAARLEQ